MLATVTLLLAVAIPATAAVDYARDVQPILQKRCYLCDPIHVNDLQAKILHCLGFDHTRLTYHHMGRNFRLTDVQGEVVTKMLA